MQLCWIPLFRLLVFFFFCFKLLQLHFFFFIFAFSGVLSSEHNRLKIKARVPRERSALWIEWMNMKS